MVKEKYRVKGEYGNTFTNLKDAKAHARWCSRQPEYGYECEVWLIENNCWYVQYINGRLTYNGFCK